MPIPLELTNVRFRLTNVRFRSSRGEGTAPRSPSASDETAEEELRSRRPVRTRRVYRFVLSHRARAGGQRTEELHRAAQAGAAGVVGAAST